MTAWENCGLRLHRADDHLTVIYHEVTTFVETIGRAVQGRFDRDSSEYVFSVAGEPPAEWGLLVGEFAHQLRAILDNLIWALVEKRGKNPDTDTGFIIADKATQWKTGWASRLKGLDKNQVALVQSRQPYLRGDQFLSHPLSRLNFINNQDKHHLLLPIASAVALVPATLGENMPLLPIVDHPAGAKIERFILSNPELTKSGADFCRVLLANPGPNPKMHVNRDIPIAVSFTGIERPIVFNDLLETRSVVGEIYAEFEALLA